MIIYEVLYTWCSRHNICSAWFLDTRLISTCFHLKVKCMQPWANDFDECTLQSVSHLNGCNLNLSDKERIILLHSRSENILNF